MVKINWSLKAEKNLKALYDYISLDSNVYASRFIKSLIISTFKLEKHPNCGRIVPEFEDNSIRELIFKNYRIVYLIDSQKKITVLAVVHCAQDIEQVLQIKS